MPKSISVDKQLEEKIKRAVRKILERIVIPLINDWFVNSYLKPMIRITVIKYTNALSLCNAKVK